MDVPYFVYLSPVDGHLECFHLSANMNNAAVSIGLLVFIGYPFLVLLGIYIGVEYLGHVATLFNFLRNHKVIFHSGCSILPFY
jgi:hypothetical protein